MAELRLRTVDGKFVVDVLVTNDITYTTDPCSSADQAREAAEQWLHWCEHAAACEVESIYYILAVPETWPGPAAGSHNYSGLHVKIGRSRDVLKRLQNLQTGTSGELIIHAIEPGSPARERELHGLFAADRRQGEWFSCSPALMQHMYDTWKRNNLLPPEHQAKLIRLRERIEIYRALRSDLGSFDMVNPSINEPWKGRVFIDLVNTKLARDDE